MQNINRWLGSGNLTRDPELKTSQGGTDICSMRVAVNSRVKSGGEWVEKANYVDVTAFGTQAKNCSQYLSKGSPIMVDGRLDWSEWEDKQGNKRQGLKVIADSVQFLPSGKNDQDNGDRQQADIPTDTSDFEPATAGAGDDSDDIPF